MSDYAQKRDVADPATVAAFARIVENPERLRLLLVLTVADIRAVGPGVWNGWKGQLMRELYGATETVFRGGRTSDAAGMARRRLRGAWPTTPAPPWSRPIPDGRGLGDRHGGRLLRRLRRRRAARPRRALAGEAAADGGAAAEARIRADRNAAEVVVAATRPRGPVRRPRPGHRRPRRQCGGRAHLHLQPRRGARRLLCAGRRRRAVRRATARARSRRLVEALEARRARRARPPLEAAQAATSAAPRPSPSPRRSPSTTTPPTDATRDRGLRPRPAGPAGGAGAASSPRPSSPSSRPTSTTTASGRSTPSTWSPGRASSPSRTAPPPSAPACWRRWKTRKPPPPALAWSAPGRRRRAEVRALSAGLGAGCICGSVGRPSAPNRMRDQRA